MLKKTDIPLLIAELSELDTMLAGLNPKSITARMSLQERKEAVEERLQELGQQPETAAFVQLLFTGTPVLDTRAIDASFAADAIYSYQDIITKATAVRRGSLGQRGVIAGATTEQARFYLTGLVRGSFGFVLEENPNGNSLFDTSLKNIVQDVTGKMSKFCNLTEDEYGVFIQDLDKRLFASFKTFFKLLHESGAQLKVVEADGRFEFNERNINNAYRRVEATQVDEEESEIEGTLLGLTPISGTFDFLSSNNTAYTGKIAPAFTSDYRNQVDQGEFFQAGRKHIATILTRTTTRGSNNPHKANFLVNLTISDDDQEPDLDDQRDVYLGR